MKKLCALPDKTNIIEPKPAISPNSQKSPSHHVPGGSSGCLFCLGVDLLGSTISVSSSLIIPHTYHLRALESKHGTCGCRGRREVSPELERSGQTSFRHLAARWQSPSLAAQP